MGCLLVVVAPLVGVVTWGLGVSGSISVAISAGAVILSVLLLPFTNRVTVVK